MNKEAIAYVKQDYYSDPRSVLQTLNNLKYRIDGLGRYYNVVIDTIFIEAPIDDGASLTKRKELSAALKYLEENPHVALLVVGEDHLSNRFEERNELLNLFLDNNYRLLSGQPLIDLAKPSDQQDLRLRLQKEKVSR